MSATVAIATGIALPFILNQVAKRALPALASKLDKKTKIDGIEYIPRGKDGKFGDPVKMGEHTEVTETEGSKRVRKADSLRQDIEDAVKNVLPTLYRSIGSAGKIAGSAGSNAAQLLGSMPSSVANIGVSEAQNRVWGDTPLQGGAKLFGSLGGAVGNTLGTTGDEIQKLLNEAARGREVINLNNRLSRELTDKAKAIQSLGLTSGEANLAGRYISSYGFGGR